MGLILRGFLSSYKADFKVELPDRIKPVFSDKLERDNPELSEIAEITFDIHALKTMNDLREKHRS